MEDLARRAKGLKEHIESEVRKVSETFNKFVQEVLTTQQFDYLVTQQPVLEFEKLFELDFLSTSPLDTTFAEMFSTQDEVSVTLPPKSNERFEVDEQLPTYWTFEENNRLATLITPQANCQNYAVVKSTIKSSAEQGISIKFIMSSSNGHFGICKSDYNYENFPGYDAISWAWACGGASYHQSGTYANHTLTDIAGHQVEMKYDVQSKTLTLTIEGQEPWSKQDDTWPDEVQFVFATSGGGQSVKILSNENSS